MSSRSNPERRATRDLALRLLVPLFLGAGMALAYLGAFHQPTPHHVPVAVVGAGPTAQVTAQRLQDGSDGALLVSTVADEAVARTQIQHRDISAAYVPDAHTPTLLYSDAASMTTSALLVDAFEEVAAAQHAPLQLMNVAPTDPDGDPSGESMFFFAVGLTVGSYTAAVVIGAAGTALRLRTRALMALLASGVISIVVTAIAGVFYGALPSHVVAIAGLAWLYSFGIVLTGAGLHTFLGRLTTPALVLLFVMLNFTSMDGPYAPALQNGFFGALHSFWNGAALVEAGRDLLYFPDLGIARYVATLIAWVGVGALVLLVAGAHERRTHAAALSVETADRAMDEELDEIAVAG
jgi:hypothetical protein